MQTKITISRQLKLNFSLWVNYTRPALFCKVSDLTRSDPARPDQRVVKSRASWHENINDIYTNDIYHNSIVIFSSENVMIFLIFSKYQPFLLLFTYLSDSCISNINCPSPQAITCCKNIDENFNPVGRAQRRRRQTQTDGSCHNANITYCSFT